MDEKRRRHSDTVDSDADVFGIIMTAIPVVSVGKRADVEVVEAGTSSKQHSVAS